MDNPLGNIDSAQFMAMPSNDRLSCMGDFFPQDHSRGRVKNLRQASTYTPGEISRFGRYIKQTREAKQLKRKEMKFL